MDLDNLECAPGLVVSAGADEDCDVCLFLGNICVSFDYMIEKEKFERIKKYKNIAAMDFSNDDSGYVYNRTAFAYADLDFAALFLTDYTLFLNPEKTCEDIIATIDFGLWDGREDCRLTFHPDGGSPSADEIQRCLDRFGTE